MEVAWGPQGALPILVPSLEEVAGNLHYSRNVVTALGVHQVLGVLCLLTWSPARTLEGTPYAGGLFRMKLLLGKDFPASPPKGYFLTKIFHPNVGANGEICVNVLKRDWTAELGIRHVLLVRPGAGPSGAALLLF